MAIPQVSKKIKLTTYKGKQLKWRCHNDATMPKVELWFQLWHCYADFEVVHTFELVTQPSENCCVAENHNVTTHFKVNTREYLPYDSIFFKVSKYSSYITRL